jgi:peptide/nickel transport system substrate-binding protein
LAEAGYPNGFESGPLYCDVSYSNVGEVAANNFAQIGIRGRLQPIERAGFLAGYSGKSFEHGTLRGASGAFGNAATRLESFVVKGGAYVYGSYPDIDALAPQQAGEIDHKRRAAVLERMQQLAHDKSIVAPIWQLAFINGVGPRVGESGFDLIKDFAYTGPYEDITIKGA